jgi:hypothetical protein
VWAALVVVEAPGFDDVSCLIQRSEQVLVEAFIPVLAIEAFDVGVLHRLAGTDEVQLDAFLVCPGIQRLAGCWRASKTDQKTGLVRVEK